MSLRPPNYEFREWWKKVREENVITFVKPTVSYQDPLSTVKIPTSSLDSRLKKEPSHNAGHLLEFQQASASSCTYVSCSSFLACGLLHCMELRLNGIPKIIVGVGRMMVN
ncbi:hypothetical protein AAC387_Pa02g4431 [Persea americana]